MKTQVGAFGYHESKGKLLIILRRNDPYSGTWSLAGGAVENGETLEKTVKRELKEETGLTVIVGKKMGEQPFKFDERDFLAHIFYVKPISGTIIPGEDVYDARYVPVSKLEEYALAPPIKAFFRHHDLP